MVTASLLLPVPDGGCRVAAEQQAARASRGQQRAGRAGGRIGDRQRRSRAAGSNQAWRRAGRRKGQKVKKGKVKYHFDQAEGGKEAERAAAAQLRWKEGASARWENTIRRTKLKEGGREKRKGEGSRKGDVSREAERRAGKKGVGC